MTNVSEDSLKSGGFSPNLYIRSILLERGGSIDVRGGSTGNGGSFIQFRQENGSLAYAPVSRGGTPAAGAMNVTLEVQVKDVVDNTTGRGFWLQDYSGRANSVMYVLQSTNPNLTNILLDGSFFDNPTAEMPPEYKRVADYEIRQISLATGDTEQAALTISTISSTGNRAVSLNSRFIFQVPQDEPRHLTYFAFVKTFSSSGRTSRLSPHSMVVVEKVIEEGLPVDQAAIFRDPEDSIWGGPVHQHPEEGWMEGAFHVSASHRSLRRVGINNFKIQDARVLSNINQYEIELGKVPNTRAEVSDAYVSRDIDNGATMMFTFDHLSYMTENSKYGKLFANSSNNVQSELLRRSRITDLSIMRGRVVPRDGVNEIGSAAKTLFDFSIESPPRVVVTSADENGVLQNQSKYVVDGEDNNKFVSISTGEEIPSDHMFYGSIQEIALEKVGRKRAFVAKDGSISRVSDGAYQYAVKIQVEDGSFSFLSEKLKEFSDMIQLMRIYLATAEDRRSFNSVDGRFTKLFINSQRVGETAVPVWLASIVLFVEVLDLLTPISQQEKTRAARSLYMLVSPQYGSVTTVQAYVNALGF